jgi:cytochrome c-type biogenesis protein CcmH/NrfG
MSEEPTKPQNPWSLNPGRVVLLALGVLLLLYFASAVFGGLGNYQQLKEASQAAKAQKVDIQP